MNAKTSDCVRKRALHSLISGIRVVFKERTLALAKLVLPFLPYGKAIAVASILIEKFPTTDATKTFYATARPRWKRTCMFHLNPYCPLSKLFALTGLFQPEMTKKLLDRKLQGTLVDIGANFGYFSVLWLEKRNTEILAIEPIRENYELLTGNLSRFGYRARTVMCCLGAENGQVTMSYDPAYPMLSKISPNTPGHRRAEMRPLRSVLEQNGIARVEVLKCDAEGHDLAILSSARGMFEKGQIHMLFFERHTWNEEPDSGLEEFCRFLVANGYRLVSNKGELDLCYELLNAKPKS
jgi:FkbM family methyltransferase